MSNPRSIDDIMNEMNDQAKAEGRYLGKTLSEIPREPGSILDVPETPESQERIARLQARRLERRKAAAEQSKPVKELQDDVKAALESQLPEEQPDLSEEHADHA